MNERETVLDILLDIDKNKAFSIVSIGKALKKNQFEEKQKRAFVTRLAEGVTETRIQLDYIIDSFSKTKVSKMKPLIRNSLRMGVYQLLYMDSVPDRAAIFETVKLVKSHGFSSLSGFVNAVLRSIERDKEKVREKVSAVPYIKYSVPQWLYDFLKETFGTDDTEKILKSASAERPTTIRVNTSKKEKPELRGMIEEKGIDVRDGFYAPDALLINGYDFIKRVPGYREGFFTVQDESSQLAVKTAFEHYRKIHTEEENDLTILDLCAAPGGKTTYAAELISGKNTASKINGNVYSFDISTDKTDLIEENIERLGLTNVRVSVSDATERREELLEKADLIIADVPCSGLGIMGRKNDIKYRVVKDDFQSLRKMADTILDNAVSYLKPGGILLFSTCTINPYENGDAADALLSRSPDMAKLEERTFLQGIDNCDGFYFCVLQKKN